MVLFDTSILLLLLEPNTNAPLDPGTGLPLAKAKARIDYAIVNLTKAKERVLIPTPVLAELFVGAGAGGISKLVEAVSSYAAFKIAPFDQLAAVELGLLQDGHPTGKPLTSVETKAKVKFDRQIVAIAKANAVGTIYSDDDGLCKTATNNKIKVVRSYDLPLPPQAGQQDMWSPETN